MSLKNVLLMSLFLMIGPFSYAIAAETATALSHSTKASSHEQKQWLFVLGADKGRIIKTKNKGIYELSLTDIDKGVIAITPPLFRDSKIVTSTQFLKDFDHIFSKRKPNAVLTYSGLLTGKKSPPITIVIQSVTVIPDFKVLLSLHPLSPNTEIPKRDIREVKLFIDTAQSL
ncbi:hypothetical protein [uncultured Shewanella sp.]|uniref:hypothetical protein n=1 Tax=uncultured Shewanella sp. TaxID=173975 RepID=UPI00262D849F|nr:hypothetical protein [uncultured Shewanella sp.]